MARALAMLLAMALHTVACSEVDPLYQQAQSLIDDYAGNLNKLREAEILLEKLHQQDPASPLPYVGWGRIISKGDYLGGTRYGRSEAREKAHEMFRKARELDPDLPDAYLFAAYPYLYQKDVEGAERMARKAESLAPNSPRVHLLYAHMAKRHGDHAEVVRRCTRVLETTDQPLLISFAHEALARAYSKLERYGLAEISYRKVIELRPASAWGHSNYSRFLASVDRFDEAIAEARKALLLMNFVRGHEMLAHAYYSKGAHLYWDLKQREDAGPWFAGAIEENPRSANAHYGLSIVHYHLANNGGGPEDLKRSRWLLDRALALKPDHPQALRQLDRLRARMGDDAENGALAAGNLRDEVRTLFAKFDREYGTPRLGKDIAREIQGARIRGIGSYEYPIWKFGEPAFDLEKLRRGQLPYYLQGDFDCDGKEDRAVLLEAPKKMVALSLGKGATLALPDYDGDVLEKGSKGSHPTAVGKGYGSPVPGQPRHFESHCDFVSVLWWGKSSYAVVYDPESSTFRRFSTSD